ncbi:MAG TPA: type VI secretion system tip protein TssI/VgrG [Bryobacteraceae bacterium]|nr:type VI secretion system tip protein TssI/VgrG [Bryobacteraceae bacterium]
MAYTQTDRPLKITTPLGPDILLLRAVQGHEEISHLFGFHVDMVADQKDEVRFDQIIGQSVTVEMRLLDDSKRYFNGIVNRFSQGRRDETFVHFSAEIVPKFWLLSKKVRSRVFQHQTVPEILKAVLVGFDVSYDITGTYYQRDYCVQYRESDFAFASRLMEEEGIYYFFKHSDGNHQMLVSDNTSKHPTVSGQSTAIYEEVFAEVRTDMRVIAWEKIQELRSGEYTLWDHTFELPTNHLEGKEKTIVTVPVGKVVHKLNLANDTLEIYDYPGRYAQRFDGIDPSGGPRPSDISHTFEDRTRTVRLRMEQEEVLGIRIEGKSDCGQFTAGHKFTLERHFDADAAYLLMRVEHEARDESYRSEQPDVAQYSYENRFVCIPEALRYRPQRVTPVPEIAGMQTATVVGPLGEEIWVDKYGRVKVQFHWDREGKMDANSSCWVRVAQVWAGNKWGAFFWPRIGHEVVVIFEEGDPDQPLIVGSVYNADNMPWFKLPINKQLAGFKSASVRGTAHQNFNAIVFNDEKGKEHLAIHSENNLGLNSEKNKMIHAGASKGERVGIANILTVGKIIPVTGGSGGGFEGGSTMNTPPPSEILGMNAMITYGDQFQLVSGVSHQDTIGQNLQMCVSLGALLAESKSLISAPPEVGYAAGAAMLLGGGMGAMVFTIGSSAQFTLGQSFEISVGPPKVEIHKSHNVKGDLTRILCILQGALTETFSLVYDSLKGANNTNNNDSGAPATQDEQSGDEERAKWILGYQGLTDVMMVAILAAERNVDIIDWYSCDAAKKTYKLFPGAFSLWGSTEVTPGAGDDAPPTDATLDTYTGGMEVFFGIVGIIVMLATELTAMGGKGGNSGDQ